VNIQPRVPGETADLSKGNHTKRSFLVNTLLILAFFAGLYLALSWLAVGITLMIPSSWEAELDLGAAIYTMAHEQVPPSARNIFDELVETAELPFPPRLHVMRDADINAFAFPGGHIVLTTGLLNAVESRDELAFVIAHELGHLRHRHLLRRFSRFLVFRLAMSFFGADPTLGSAFGTAEKLDSLSFSRGQERQSDRYALGLCHETYGHVIDPAVFFDRLDNGAESLALLSTHPMPPARVEKLRNIILKKGLTVVEGNPL